MSSSPFLVLVDTDRQTHTYMHAHGRAGAEGRRYRKKENRADGCLPPNFAIFSCGNSSTLTTGLVHKEKRVHTPHNGLQFNVPFWLTVNKLRRFIQAPPSPTLEEKNIVPKCFLTAAPLCASDCCDLTSIIKQNHPWMTIYSTVSELFASSVVLLGDSDLLALSALGNTSTGLPTAVGQTSCSLQAPKGLGFQSETTSSRPGGAPRLHPLVCTVEWAVKHPGDSAVHCRAVRLPGKPC